MPTPISAITITNEDVAWACESLRLPLSAFVGVDGRDPRWAILRDPSTIDVEACPGSGKTTLLIAKLAILARKWTSRRTGICVISHTNVARREIEGRLGSTAEGRSLLSYPHFVGTIHGFVNEFLATPWLRSKGFVVQMVDDDVALTGRWNRLPPPTKTALERNKHTHAVLKVLSTDFSLGRIRWGRGELGEATQTYKAMVKACKASLESGYFCHDEMFVWAADLLKHVPEAAETLVARFPLLFLDEVQDNSEQQSKLLFDVFGTKVPGVVRQRFGDSNQAIFSYGEVEPTTDTFPSADAKREIATSHRFGQEIADFAKPLAATPQELIGQGPDRSVIQTDCSGAHTIFVFDGGSIGAFSMPMPST